MTNDRFLVIAFIISLVTLVVRDVDLRVVPRFVPEKTVISMGVEIPVAPSSGYYFHASQHLHQIGAA